MNIKVWVKTHKVGSECSTVFEVDDAEWKEKSDNDREEMAKEVLGMLYEWGYYEEDEPR